MPPKGQSTAWSATAEYPENGLPAIEAAYQVGNIVAQKFISGWATYRDEIPR
jgi:purine nucleoside permease